MRTIKISAVLLACAAGAFAFSPSFAAPDEHGTPQERIEHFCSNNKMGEKIAEFQARRAEHIAERLKLTDAQKAAFKDLHEVRAKAMTDGKAAFCASKPDFSTFEKRLALRQDKLQRRLDELKAEAPKLIAFFNSLDDKQKQVFIDEMVRLSHERGLD